jgi:hypothetical protein
MAVSFSLLLEACAVPLGAQAPLRGAAHPDQALCPFAVADAKAWINLMPSIGPARRPLIVTAELKDPLSLARLSASNTQAPSSLILDLIEDPFSTTPGRVSWRSDASQETTKKVLIQCRGVNLHVIESVEIVQ